MPSNSSLRGDIGSLIVGAQDFADDQSKSVILTNASIVSTGSTERTLCLSGSCITADCQGSVDSRE